MMARRSDHSRPELKELAIQAGWKLIEDEGFANFSARKVATAIGYTIGTIYNVFDTHDNLILHINAVTLDDWYAAMQDAMKGVKPKQSIATLATFYIDYSHAHRNRWLALFEHRLDDTTALPDWYQEKLGRFFAFLENALIEGTDCNRKQARRDAQVLWAGIHGISILSLTGKLALVGADTPQKLALALVERYVD